MASRIFQSMMLQMKETISRPVGVIDAGGLVVACTDLQRIGESRADVMAELGFAGELIFFAGDCYQVTGERGAKLEYAVFVEGDDEQAQRICNLVAIAIGNIQALYDEKHDKATFIKNIILDNILPGDIYIKSRELHFGSEVPRIVFLIRQQGTPEVSAIDTVAKLFPDKNHDFVLHITESDIVVVKELRQNVEQREITMARELIRTAEGIEQALDKELSVKCLIGIGTVCNQMKDIAKSFKEAQTAIEVGVVFDTEKSIISFENLGIGRLIYQLPMTLCEMFLSEVFKKGSIESLDSETLFTIQKFFENNLNVSETSRKLFVHRNTLVYRLEKIKKLTGLDLREFDHAIVFKVALMVRKYLTSREEGR